MIRYGHQKKGEQEYKCNRCEARFNRRKGTPLEGLRTQIYVILMAMAMYMCDVSEGMVAAVAGKQEKTVERWIRWIAPHCEVLIKQELSKRNHNFSSLYLQMYELWSYLWRKKTKVRIWTGIDVVTRLFIVFHIGNRSSDSAKLLIKTIKARTHGVPRLITTDGLEAYVGQIKAYFRGSMYAPVVKEWDGVRISRVYNFVRPHMSLTLGKGRGKQKRTPAIVAGIEINTISL